jgi:hypothetical protein
MLTMILFLGLEKTIPDHNTGLSRMWGDWCQYLGYPVDVWPAMNSWFVSIPPVAYNCLWCDVPFEKNRTILTSSVQNFVSHLVVVYYSPVDYNSLVTFPAVDSCNAQYCPTSP